jgi:hypothetical protein
LVIVKHCQRLTCREKRHMQQIEPKISRPGVKY